MKLFAQLTIFFALFCFCAAGFSKNNSVELNPVAVAKAETQVMQGYQLGDKAAMQNAIANKVALQFGLSKDQSAQLAQIHASAIKQLGAMEDDASRDDYRKELYPIFLSFYQTLNRYFPVYSPAQAAEGEFEWWYQWRGKGNDSALSVSQAIAKLYAGIYGPNHQQAFERAAYLRTVAGEYENSCHHGPWQGGCSDNDFKAIQANLTLSFEFIKLATDKPNKQKSSK